MKAQAVLFSLLMLLVQVWPWGFISATTADWVMAPLRPGPVRVLPGPWRRVSLASCFDKFRRRAGGAHPRGGIVLLAACKAKWCCIGRKLRYVLLFQAMAHKGSGQES